ncbi:MAG: Na+/H+ antiporter NhaC, partial [Lysinibacillus sp.]
MSKQTIRKLPLPSLKVALIPLISMIVILFTGLFVFEADAHIPIVLSAIIAAVVALFIGYTWKEIEQGIINGISLSLQAVLILIILGMVISTWLAAGVVPSMIYYGLDFLSPAFFLPLSIIICSIVAVASGNAWTAAGTIGIAVMGIGIVLGFNPAMVAGAVISGCYFGDKLSPLSETTNMSPGVVGVELFDHIRHMFWTTIPAWIISIILFFFIGLSQEAASQGVNDITVIQTELNSLFTISPWLLLVPVIVLTLIALKMPAIPGLLTGAVLGAIVAVLVQGVSFTDILSNMIYGFAMESENEVLNNLLNNGGTEAMMYTVSLVMLAMSLGGILEMSGVLESLVNSLLKIARTSSSLIITTVATCIATNIIACDQYLSILIPGRMYLKAYRKKGLHPKNLSRTLEDAGTMTSPLVPWNTCGVFMASTLGVATLEYLPFAFLCIISPIVAVIYALFNFKVTPLPADEMEAEALTLVSDE